MLAEDTFYFPCHSSLSTVLHRIFIRKKCVLWLINDAFKLTSVWLKRESLIPKVYSCGLFFLFSWGKWGSTFFIVCEFRLSSELAACVLFWVLTIIVSLETSNLDNLIKLASKPAWLVVYCANCAVKLLWTPMTSYLHNEADKYKKPIKIYPERNPANLLIHDQSSCTWGWV